MNKTSKNIITDELLKIIEMDSSNSWDDLCDKCSSIIKDSGMTSEEIDKIIEECKRV